MATKTRSVKVLTEQLARECQRRDESAAKIKGLRDELKEAKARERAATATAPKTQRRVTISEATSSES